MSHPDTVVYLEHDGKVLLVDSHGQGPKLPIKGRQENEGRTQISNCQGSWRTKY